MALKSVLLTTYQSAFLNKSGGENEIVRFKKELTKLNVITSILGFESSEICNYDNVIHFGSNIESLELVKNIKKTIKQKLFLIPNLWFTEKPSEKQINEYQYFFNLFNYIIFKSNAERKHLEEYFNFKKIINIKPGIDTFFTKKADKSLFQKLYNLEKYVFSHGTIEKRKNQLTICKAIKNLNIPFVFAGNIRENDYFNDCKNLLGKNFIYLGNLDPAENLLLSAIASCTVFIEIPLDYPGVSSLEAAYLNRPLILSDDNWSREHFKNEYLVEALEIKKIRNLIVEILNKKEREQNINKKFQKYTYPNCIKKLITFLN